MNAHPKYRLQSQLPPALKGKLPTAEQLDEAVRSVLPAKGDSLRGCPEFHADAPKQPGEDRFGQRPVHFLLAWRLTQERAHDARQRLPWL